MYETDKTFKKEKELSIPIWVGHNRCPETAESETSRKEADP